MGRSDQSGAAVIIDVTEDATGVTPVASGSLDLAGLANVAFSSSWPIPSR